MSKTPENQRSEGQNPQELGYGSIPQDIAGEVSSGEYNPFSISHQRGSSTSSFDISGDSDDGLTLF